MKKILFITSVYRCGEKTFPIIPELSKHYHVDVLFNSQMSRKSPWFGNLDLRLAVYKSFEKCCRKTVHGVPYRGKFSIKNVLKSLSPTDYSLVIFDDIKITNRHGTEFMYRKFKNRSIPIVFCPHGNWNYRSHHANGSRDHCFVFGKKDKKYITGKHLLPGGVPANDALKSYARKSKYVLFILSMYHETLKKVDGLKCLNAQKIIELGLAKIAKAEGLTLIIKAKNRYPSARQSRHAFEPLKKIRGAKVVLDVKDDNKLIAEAKYVISCPSTMAFKPIQLGIPTVILGGYGQKGSLFDFRGFLKNPNQQLIHKELIRQEKLGKCVGFIKRTLDGGINFSSTQSYVQKIMRILGD